MPRTTRISPRLMPEIQRLAREGDARDGGLLMASGIPEANLQALRERDAADPRRVAFRAASADAKRRSRRSKVSLARVSLGD